MVKIPFKKYLKDLLGKKTAGEILTLGKDRVIVVTGRGGPGKATLAKVLNEHGYKAIDPTEFLLVELDEPIKEEISCYWKHIK